VRSKTDMAWCCDAQDAISSAMDECPGDGLCQRHELVLAAYSAARAFRPGSAASISAWHAQIMVARFIGRSGTQAHMKAGDFPCRLEICCN